MSKAILWNGDVYVTQGTKIYNNKVLQEEIENNNEYEILLSGTSDNITRTEGANKSIQFRFNPLQKQLSLGSNMNEGIVLLKPTLLHLSDGYDGISITTHDIELFDSPSLPGNNTWDGTNVSLKSALAGKAASATTLAGYGITDAKIESGTITLGSNTIIPLTSHQSVVDSDATLAWNTRSKIGSVGSTDIHVTMPSNPNTDENVKQTNNTTDADYYVLLSGSSSTLTKTEGTNKSNDLYFNPSKKALTLGYRLAGNTVGINSIALGVNTIASGNCSFAVGGNTTASGINSHAEGQMTVASGNGAHAEGGTTTASGSYSHSEGQYTIANHKSQHVFGEYNIADDSTAATTEKGNYIEIVGNGTSSSVKANARTLDWSGNEMLAGNLSLAGASSDISLTGTNNTWDGTNTSLKDALDGKSSTSHNHNSTYLKLSGGTMTGLISTSTAHGGAWNKARDNAFIRSHGYANQGAYYPAISWCHQGGNWSIGSLGNSNYLYLSHVRDTEYSGNNNSDNYYLAPPADGNAHSYQIAHSGNVGTGDSNGQVKIAGTNVSVKGWTDFLPLTGGTLTGNTWVKRASGESYLGATNTASGKNIYLYAADSGNVGIYSNIGTNLMYMDTNKKLTIGGTTYGFGNVANFRSALGLGDMATQSTSRLILWKMNSRTNITQSNTDDYWTVGQFPAKSGYTRYVMQIQLNNRAMVASYYTLESNNDIRVYTRKLAGTSQTFSIDVICVYMPDANKTT